MLGVWKQTQIYNICILGRTSFIIKKLVNFNELLIYLLEKIFNRIDSPLILIQ